MRSETQHRFGKLIMRSEHYIDPEPHDNWAILLRQVSRSLVVMTRPHAMSCLDNASILVLLYPLHSTCYTFPNYST